MKVFMGFVWLVIGVELKIAKEVCPFDMIMTEKGCITDCKADRFSKCSKHHAEQFKPNFCGFHRSGKWNEYSSECQACQASGCVGVIKGPCQQRPNIPGQKPVTCGKDRPTQKTCPQRTYITKPALNFCGVTFSGQKQGFDLGCSACKNRNIQLYYNCPCSNVPKAQVGNPQPQPPNNPKQKPCTNDKGCLKWQFCLNQLCLDRCAMMRCASGGCSKGKCQSAN